MVFYLSPNSITIMATKKGIKSEAVTETVEVAGLDIETTPVLEAVEPTETVERKKSVNVLLARYTPEDLYNRNPEIYERFYKTLEPMGIAGDRDELFNLLDRYLDWYGEKQKELEAQEQQKRAEAEKKVRKLAEQLGLSVTVA